MKWVISNSEYLQRIEGVKKRLTKRGLDALYLTNSTSIFYLTGFSCIMTERPIALVIPVDGAVTLMAPLLEEDHVKLKTSIIENVLTYYDYPGKKHPIEYFAQFLGDIGLAEKRFGIDNKAGASARWGYRGPSISKKLRKASFTDMGSLIPSLRLTKSEGEISLLRESAKWANLAHSLLQEYTYPGMWDVEISLEATREAALIMKKVLGPNFSPLRRSVPVSAGFRGQVGEMSAIPHSISTGREIRKGDVLVTGATAEVGGYTCELERTMIVGNPTPKQRRYFKLMVKAQEAAINLLKSGVKCSDVDKASQDVFRKAGQGKLIKHHTGHGLGLEGHEPPWLDVGCDDRLRANMVVSCEPGIYEAGFAGFRHSDTVLVTKDEGIMLTYYPRNLEALTISAD